MKESQKQNTSKSSQKHVINKGRPVFQGFPFIHVPWFSETPGMLQQPMADAE
jgi:hypothetical protein